MHELEAKRRRLESEIMHLRLELAELRGMTAHFLPTGSDLSSQPVFRLQQIRDHLDFCVTHFDDIQSDVDDPVERRKTRRPGW